MYDIDFIRQPRLRTHLIHLYLDGCFRSEVEAHVRAAAGERGWMWQRMDPRSPSVPSGGGLYGEVLVAVDLDALHRYGDGVAILDSMLRCLRDSKETHFYIHGSSSPLFGTAAWDRMLNAATVLHEPRLSVGTLPRLLDHAGPGLSLPLDRVTNRPSLEASLKQWVGTCDLTLPQFLSWLDVLVATCVHAETGQFDPAAFERAVAGTQPPSPQSWVGPIARFLHTRSDRDRMALLGEVDRAVHQEGLSAHEIVRVVFRASFDLAQANEATNPGHGVIPPGWSDFRWQQSRAHGGLRIPALIRWQTLLAHNEPLLLSRGIVAWDLLLRQVQGVDKT